MTPWQTVIAVVSVAFIVVLFVASMMDGVGDAERERKAFEEARKNCDGSHLGDVIAGRIDCPFCLPNHRRK
ncbi:hypothetical protein [Candidatus Binatus sp.]|uniref:hypothetical protein n=1 Tax=Candidatus Binatus sp. TaxID=2811406 RepID=UPI003C70ED58